MAALVELIEKDSSVRESEHHALMMNGQLGPNLIFQHLRGNVESPQL